MGKTRLTNDRENLVEGGRARWHGSQKIFYQVCKLWSGSTPPPSFSAFSQIFPLGFNIYEDYDHLYMMTLKSLFHSWYTHGVRYIYVRYFHLDVLISKWKWTEAEWKYRIIAHTTMPWNLPAADRKMVQ